MTRLVSPAAAAAAAAADDAALSLLPAGVMAEDDSFRGLAGVLAPPAGVVADCDATRLFLFACPVVSRRL